MIHTFQIGKPQCDFLQDDYCYKIDYYNIVAQAMVDCNKRFTNVFGGLPWSVNDSNIL